MIATRISNLVPNCEVFADEIEPYQKALDNAGYNDRLKYNQRNRNAKNKPRKRGRKILWFNPPYSSTVLTNVASKFLKLIDKHFKNTELYKLFNRSNVKVSYSCLQNIEAIISGHNKRLLNNDSLNQNTSSCNCRGGIQVCPLGGKCLLNNVIYKAVVSHNNEESTYLGQASTTFKKRFSNHMKSFKNKMYRNSTSLSKLIWSLKESDIPYSIKWNVEAQAPSYSTASRNCRLCNLEKTLILFNSYHNLLNKRSELLNRCRHRKKHTLSNG